MSRGAAMQCTAQASDSPAPNWSTHRVAALGLGERGRAEGEIMRLDPMLYLVVPAKAAASCFTL